MTADVITVLRDNVATTEVAGADVLLPMAVAASAENAALAAAQYQAMLDVQALGDDAAAIAARVRIDSLAASGGSDLVGYVPDGVGAVVRTVGVKLRERGVSIYEFGSSNIGNGVADATLALEKAAATGEALYIPPTDNSFMLSGAVALNAGQRVTGDGRLSRMIQTGAEANASIFFVDNADGVCIEKLWLTPGTTTTTQIAGYPIHFRNSADLTVKGVQVSGHRRGAVVLEGCTNARLFKNYAHSSVINPAVDDHSTAGADFLVINGGEDIDIVENWAINGAGVGVLVISQLSAPGYTFKRIRTARNRVRGQGQYGISGYRSQMTDVFEDISFDRNLVSDITGAVAHSTYGKVYGAGIYIQGIEGARANFNTIRRTNTATLIEQLAPAGLGIANCRDVQAEGNTIEDCAWYGLMATDSNIQGLAGATGRFNNIIRRSGKDNIYLKDFPKAVVSGEASGSTGGAGFKAIDVGVAISELYNLHDLHAVGNSGPGVYIADGDATYTNVRATGNQSGAIVDGTGTHTFIGGEYSGNTNWGIAANSATPEIETKNVLFGSNGLSDLYCDVPIKGLETNTYPSGTPFSGPYAEPRTLANSAGPSVKNGRRFVTGGTTAITSLADLAVDQEVIIKAAHTVTVLGQALTSGKVLTAYNDGSGAVVKSVSP